MSIKKITFLIVLFLFQLEGFSQISILDRDKALELNNKGFSELKAGNYNAAKKILTQAIELDSTIKIIYLNLLQAYSYYGEHDLAENQLLKAKKIFIEDDELLYYLGNIYQKKDKFDLALKEYDLAIKYSKVNGEDFDLVYAYYFNRGICHLKTTNYKAALYDFNHTLELDSLNVAAYSNRAITNYYLKQKDKACLDWKKALELGNESVKTHIERFCK